MDLIMQKLLEHKEKRLLNMGFSMLAEECAANIIFTILQALQYEHVIRHKKRGCFTEPLNDGDFSGLHHIKK